MKYNIGQITRSITVSKKIKGININHENGLIDFYKKGRKVLTISISDLRRLGLEEAMRRKPSCEHKWIKCWDDSLNERTCTKCFKSKVLFPQDFGYTIPTNEITDHKPTTNFELDKALTQTEKHRIVEVFNNGLKSRLK